MTLILTLPGSIHGLLRRGSAGGGSVVMVERLWTTPKEATDG